MQPITQLIFANNNLAIQIAPQSWQLLMRADSSDPDMLTPLVEASRAGLTCQPTFAQARSLPATFVPDQQIETVVVGWERKDGCWYLGLLFSPDLAQARGGRWCGLARWSDPTGLIEFQSAELAGRGLADTLQRPFRLVTDQLRPEATPATSDDSAVMTDELSAAVVNTEAPRLTEVQPLDAPVKMGDWTLARNENGLIWQHSTGWRNGMIVRVIFFAALALLFVALSLGGLSSLFAPVQPDWLPLVGLVVAAVLAINAISHAMRLFMAGTVEFDQRLQMIRWQQPRKGITRQVPFEKVQYVLLSYTVLRSEKMKGTTPPDAFEHLTVEMWLHIARDIGDFIECGHIGPIEGRGVRQTEILPRQPVDLAQMDTPLHHAARLIADLLNVQAFIERRN